MNTVHSPQGKPKRKLLMEYNLIENMRETAKSLCQLWEASDLWEDQNCQFVNDYTAIFLFQSLCSKSYLQINFIQLKEKNKHVVLKEPSFFPSFLMPFFLLLILFFIHTSIQCLFSRESDVISVVLFKVKIWLFFSYTSLKIMKNRYFVRGKNKIFLFLFF